MTEDSQQIRRPPLTAAPPDPAALARHRRKLRRRWFLFAELLSLAVLLGSVVAGISERFTAESLTPLFRVLPIAAAIIAGILPIVYFSNPKRGMR